MVSLAKLVECEICLSWVQRVSSVGVTDVSSLAVTRRRWFVLRVLLVLLRAVGLLFHRRYKYLSWAWWLFLFLIIYIGILYRVNSLSYVLMFSWCVVRNTSCRVSYLQGGSKFLCVLVSLWFVVWLAVRLRVLCRGVNMLYVLEVLSKLCRLEALCELQSDGGIIHINLEESLQA